MIGCSRTDDWIHLIPDRFERIFAIELLHIYHGWRLFGWPGRCREQP